MLSARHRIVYVDSYGLKTLDSTEKAVVDIRPPKKMKKRRELDALANGKKHAVASSTTAQPTDRRSLVVPDDSSSSDAFVSTKRGPGQLTTNRYWKCIVVCSFMSDMDINGVHVYYNNNNSNNNNYYSFIKNGMSKRRG